MVRPSDASSNMKEPGSRSTEGRLARLCADRSNQLFQILANWNQVLKFTSLNQNEPPPVTGKWKAVVGR
jgi:hypothetical protein